LVASGSAPRVIAVSLAVIVNLSSSRYPAKGKADAQCTEDDGDGYRLFGSSWRRRVTLVATVLVLPGVSQMANRSSEIDA
jgi:hypothetical protein